MKSKIGKIFLITVLVLVTILFQMESKKNAFGQTINGPLTRSEMVRTLGRCFNCTINEDFRTDCDQDGCAGCYEWTSCINHGEYGTGKYFFSCYNNGYPDGVCMDGGLVDCYYEYFCDDQTGHLSPRRCDGNNCYMPETGGIDCTECIKGERILDDPVRYMSQFCY